MANNSRNDDFPTIRLDEEDRRGYQTKTAPVHRSVTTSQTAASKEPEKAKGGSGWGVVALLVAIVGCGAAGYLFTVRKSKVPRCKTQSNVSSSWKINCLPPVKRLVNQP